MTLPNSHDRHSPQPKPALHTGVVVSCASGVEIGAVALQRLEELDDAVFAALAGDPVALDLSRSLWNDATRVVDARLLSESRAQYARHARTVWDASRDNPVDSLGRAFAALEVLGLLDDE